MDWPERATLRTHHNKSAKGTWWTLPHEARFLYLMRPPITLLCPFFWARQMNKRQLCWLQKSTSFVRWRKFNIMSNNAWSNSVPDSLLAKGTCYFALFHIMLNLSTYPQAWGMGVENKAFKACCYGKSSGAALPFLAVAWWAVARSVTVFAHDAFLREKGQEVAR